MSGLTEQGVDQLILELVRDGRAGTAEQVEQIRARISGAPFDRRQARVRVRHRGMIYLGQTLGAWADSLIYHLVKRVRVERQWADGTTVNQYVDDLRRAAAHPGARLMLYHRGDENIAATMAPTDDVLPADRMGVGALPLLLVVYSADRHAVVSGYQFSGVSALNLPEEVVWHG